MASIGLVAIQSVRFPNAFLRMGANLVTQTNNNGSGTVNCQYYDQSHGPNYPTPNIGNSEVFDLIPLGGNPGAYAIRSLAYPQAFLRINGSNVSQRETNGSGTVNCQYYSGGVYPQYNSSDYEHFLIGPAVLRMGPNPEYYFISAGQFSHAFLRIDGSALKQFESQGGGTVNCQYYSGGSDLPNSVDQYEVFNIIYLSHPNTVST
jgi:hypothetical protein